ncbi:MAG: sugar nucleotide-binding protein [Acidobacteriota bacterium]|nr:sugar nucleotide-binding protein [Acidobacteriota bacterium]
MPTSDSETPRSPQPELWGGVECTVNRVGGLYFDQLERSGHARRAADLELFAALGLRALRYPVLWERTAPGGLERADWTWPDERLTRLRSLGLRPIVGLVHHGSGPRTTSLVDAAFPEKLARFARAVAERYPWVEDYTPVNEPLTTARFSGLYGHWYPHGRDDRTFARALVTQCRAVALSMRAVREVNPRARLVQTEDLGKTFGTRALSYQAEFENERRWVTFDLLCGRVSRAHTMWGYLIWAGIEEAELEWFRANACPPDIVGVNHYLTSERFLDERLERYPPHTHGGNGRHAYADVEAVRARAEGCAGPRALLKEAWERYRLPLAVTEAHLGCTREEQLRWFVEVWDAARDLREEGADVRAVTAWALLGSFDWDSLLTRAGEHYEPGVFDLRAPAPRPTALARLLRELARGEEPTHAVLGSPGWWQRLERLLYLPEQKKHANAKAMAAGASGKLGVVGARARTEAAGAYAQPLDGNVPVGLRGGKARTLLLTGATGTLGRAFARACRARAIPYRLLTRAEMDIADPSSVESALEEFGPWAVVNAAGYVRVDDAEREPELCRRENADGPAVLADACAARGVALVTFSSDLVFDGSAQRPYVERDVTSPLNAYGQSKAEAEARVLAAHPSALVVRTSAFFGPEDDYNFVTVALRTLAGGRRFAAARDSVVSPTYVPDLACACLDLLIDGERGLWHLSNQGALTWAELARRAARLAGLDADLVEARPSNSLGLVAARPRFSALASERGLLLPPLESALRRYVRERAAPPSARSPRARA